MKCDKKTMLLYAVTDRAWVGRQSLYEQVECALKGGATCVQVREKKLGDEDFLEEAKQIAALCSISLPAARFRAARMAELYERERAFLMTRGRSCFLLSPLERQVYEAFADYIAAHRRGS